MWPNPQETADFVTFTEEILNEKLQILGSRSIKVYKSFLFKFPCSVLIPDCTIQKKLRISHAFQCCEKCQQYMHANYSEYISNVQMNKQQCDISIKLNMEWKQQFLGVLGTSSLRQIHKAHMKTPPWSSLSVVMFQVLLKRRLHSRCFSTTFITVYTKLFSLNT